MCSPLDYTGDHFLSAWVFLRLGFSQSALEVNAQCNVSHWTICILNYDILEAVSSRFASDVVRETRSHRDLFISLFSDDTCNIILGCKLRRCPSSNNIAFGCGIS